MNRQNRLLIVPAMTKTTLALVLLVFAALPAVAQTSELGILFGGVSRQALRADKGTNGLTNNAWTLSGGAKEIYFSIVLEPQTRFRIKAGQMNSKVTFVTGTGDTAVRDHRDGQVEHVEGVVDYRFSEPFGSTGLFVGVGMYKQSAGGMSETNYGLSAGVNGDFPLSKRYGIVVEGTYHWINFADSSRYLTATAGLRISF